MVKAKLINAEDFKKYGSFNNIYNHEWPHLGGSPTTFYRELMIHDAKGTDSVGMSCCFIEKRPFEVDAFEKHDTACETLIFVDQDVLMPMAPATCEGCYPEEKDMEVFFCPKGTMLTMRPGVWHMGAYVLGDEPVSVLTVLPERIYVNDCKVHKFEKIFTFEV